MRGSILASGVIVWLLISNTQEISAQQDGDGEGQQSCPALTARSMRVTCEAAGNKGPCTETQPPGTKARISWKKMALGDNKTPTKATGLSCQPSGDWRTELTKRVPSNYSLIRNVGYYKYYTDSLVWEIAAMVCAKDGGHLVVMDNLEEMDAVFKYIRLFVPAGVVKGLHIGLHDKVVEGKFMTVLGDPMPYVETLAWLPGEPATGKQAEYENCVALILPEYKLQDLDC